jgi:hypothetical protein
MEVRVDRSAPRATDQRNNTLRSFLWLALALVVFGVAMRFLPHPANLAPVGAIALFGGAILPRKLAWWLPLAIMIISDYFIGFYSGIGFVWLSFLLIGLYGMLLRGQGTLARIGLGALGSSVLFFLVSNFGVWLQGHMYPLTWSGLVECYTMALPFFRNTFFGDVLYGSLLFGAWALAETYARKRGQTTTQSELP